ncbi:hypothetical protein COT97_00165 [Candidatus Falkowbacteria bacterium CG10_big_fil_rev_8_21_14_0_10_39_11]|uniref:Glycosyltransferase 2-like domain-containing protein n=1 Tax=Candidatus Falkowbacteria bacterium CG10_big_fil_rev_8_21_14_0_10_39_11 TaxID=1974565 RepID=A0A2H0V8K6_9BACT|nr:MAG: hypothetical protein COT97_00165 [Candidatus Falkowbacteria bacterium CG10_big_fil_rev_8_21_14_0_10_39_11]
MSKVSVNLVTWNGANYIIGCLESLFAQTYPDFSLMIIDNGSTDETVELINEKYPHLRIVKHRDNLGFAKAHNQAIHWTDGEYVLLLNQDIILEPNFIEKLVQFADTQEKGGAFTGKILRLQDSQKTKYIDSLGLKIFKNHRTIDLGAGELDESQYDAVEEVFGVSGAIPLYRRSALQAVQMDKQFFDEDFFSYKEDVDLAYRLRYAGWKAFKVPISIAYHDRTIAVPQKDMSKIQLAKARRGRSKFANYYSYRNHWFFLIKELPSTKLKYLFPVLRFELLKFFYILFLETSNLKTIKEVWNKRKHFQAKRKIIKEKQKIKTEEIDSWFA